MPDPKRKPDKKQDKKPAPPAKLPPFEKDSPELVQHKKDTYDLKAAALGEIQAQIAALRALIASGTEPARSPRLLDLLLREIQLRELIEAEAAAPPLPLAAPQPVAVTPEATFRDSTEQACGAGGAAPAVGHTVLDYGEERTVTVKIRNTGRPGTDCSFTVNLLGAPPAPAAAAPPAGGGAAPPAGGGAAPPAGGGAAPPAAAPAPKASQKLDPGQSVTLRRPGVQIVEIVCDPPVAGAVAPRCKASYTFLVAPAGA